MGKGSESTVSEELYSSSAGKVKFGRIGGEDEAAASEVVLEPSTATKLFNIGNRVVGKLSETVLLPVVEKGLIPDVVIRQGIRMKVADRKQAIRAGTSEERMQRKQAFVAELKTLPIAMQTVAANEQHYEVPTEFYLKCLGPRLKYSSGYWPSAATTFEESEVAMLELYCERAELQDGMKLLDLGCGWGSVTLYMAAKYPKLQVTGVSNSDSQRKFILKRAAERGLSNVSVVTQDVNTLENKHVPGAGTFDRVISIEMFEHMKNYEKLMRKVADLLRPGGKLFVHIFSHVHEPYHFGDGWMARTFFTGGTMPSDDLLLYFAKDMGIEEHWNVPGYHYQRTSEAWLNNLDANKQELMPLLEATYGAGNGLKWYNNWRLFFLSCAEMFGFDKGEEWVVSHYRFVKK